MIAHLSPQALEEFAIGAYEGPERADLEAHLTGCVECTQRLAEEARLEAALFEVVRSIDFCVGCEQPCTTDRCDHCGAAKAPGGYRAERVLVQSDQGRVYLARAPGGERVALKELVFTRIPDLSTIESFEREGRVLRQLYHPRIPRYLDSFTEGDAVNIRFYLAQTYVEGRSLADRLEEHRYDEAEARQIAKEVLEILVYLQGLSPQVFHRDLKPSNLIQRADGTITLVDFGSARERGATIAGTFAGTFGYAAREQLVGMVDASSDLFALGATLIHLLTRTPPWSALGDGLILAKAHLSLGMRRWIARLTAAEPRDRFPSAQAALVALERLDEPRRPWPMLAGLAAAGTVAGVAIRLLSVDPLPPPVAAPVVAPAQELMTPAELSRPPTPPVVVPPEPPPAKARTVLPPRPPATPAPQSGGSECKTIPNVPSGFVTLDTEPWSKIYYEGRLLGETPLSKVRLPSGCVEIVAVREGHPPTTVKLKVEPNKNLRYKFHVSLR
ncbi:MAG: serine/threonine protein kinase [Deltaproteobacteria bacterium]|nr:serine/threonine protein kinase [Deltaproteobacteria bacterium]